MRNFLLFLSVALILLNVSCLGEIAEEEDASIQAAEDSTLIVNYLADQGFEDDQIGTLETGVYYVILDSGTQVADGQLDTLSIDESDHVTFDYVGVLLNDTIFDTSIKEVADSIRVIVEANITEGDTLDVEYTLLAQFAEDRTYAPSEITYSDSGWPFDGDFIAGYTDGIASTFKYLNVGGKVLIVIPSAQAYGTATRSLLIGPNTVLAFELYPVSVEKQ